MTGTTGWHCHLHPVVQRGGILQPCPRGRGQHRGSSLAPVRSQCPARAHGRGPPRRRDGVGVPALEKPRSLSLHSSPPGPAWHKRLLVSVAAMGTHDVAWLRGRSTLQHRHYERGQQNPAQAKLSSPQNISERRRFPLPAPGGGSRAAWHPAGLHSLPRTLIFSPGSLLARTHRARFHTQAQPLIPTVPLPAPAARYHRDPPGRNEVCN